MKKVLDKKIERLARTKIVATLGPASSSYSVLRKMVMAGLNVARFNFSHGTQKEQRHLCSHTDGEVVRCVP